MNFITFGNKSVRADLIEAVTQYRNELTIQCPHHAYTVYYSTTEDAQEGHATVLKQLEDNHL